MAKGYFGAWEISEKRDLPNQEVIQSKGRDGWNSVCGSSYLCATWIGSGTLGGWVWISIGENSHG